MYQVCDDVRAVWGEQAETGKQSLHDVTRRKATLPMLLGFQVGSAKLVKLLRESTDTAPTFDAVQGKYIADELTALGVHETCLGYVVKYRDEALGHLRRTESSCPEHAMLVSMVKLCAESALAERAGSAHAEDATETNARAQR
jgi:geranylgeranyl pyrophosphate synthase